MTDVQVALSPSLVIEPMVEIHRVQSRSSRRRVNAGSTSYLEGPGKGRPIVTGPIHRRTVVDRARSLLTYRTYVPNMACVSGRERKEGPQFVWGPSAFVGHDRASRQMLATLPGVMAGNCTPVVRPAQYPNGVFR